jgi:hypothetical protein
MNTPKTKSQQESNWQLLYRCAASIIEGFKRLPRYATEIYKGFTTSSEDWGISPIAQKSRKQRPVRSSNFQSNGTRFVDSNTVELNLLSKGSDLEADLQKQARNIPLNVSHISTRSLVINNNIIDNRSVTSRIQNSRMVDIRDKNLLYKKQTSHTFALENGKPLSFKAVSQSMSSKDSLSSFCEEGDSRKHAYRNSRYGLNMSMKSTKEEIGEDSKEIQPPLAYKVFEFYKRKHDDIFKEVPGNCIRAKIIYENLPKCKIQSIKENGFRYLTLDKQIDQEHSQITNNTKMDANFRRSRLEKISAESYYSDKSIDFGVQNATRSRPYGLIATHKRIIPSKFYTESLKEYQKIQGKAFEPTNGKKPDRDEEIAEKMRTNRLLHHQSPIVNSKSKLRFCAEVAIQTDDQSVASSEFRIDNSIFSFNNEGKNYGELKEDKSSNDYSLNFLQRDLTTVRSLKGSASPIIERDSESKSDTDEFPNSKKNFFDNNNLISRIYESNSKKKCEESGASKENKKNSLEKKSGNEHLIPEESIKIQGGDFISRASTFFKKTEKDVIQHKEVSGQSIEEQTNHKSTTIDSTVELKDVVKNEKTDDLKETAPSSNFSFFAKTAKLAPANSGSFFAPKKSNPVEISDDKKDEGARKSFFTSANSQMFPFSFQKPENQNPDKDLNSAEPLPPKETDTSGEISSNTEKKQSQNSKSELSASFFLPKKDETINNTNQNITSQPITNLTIQEVSQTILPKHSENKPELQPSTFLAQQTPQIPSQMTAFQNESLQNPFKIVESKPVNSFAVVQQSNAPEVNIKNLLANRQSSLFGNMKKPEETQVIAPSLTTSGIQDTYQRPLFSQNENHNTSNFLPQNISGSSGVTNKPFNSFGGNSSTQPFFQVKNSSQFPTSFNTFPQSLPAPNHFQTQQTGSSSYPEVKANNTSSFELENSNPPTDMPKSYNPISLQDNQSNDGWNYQKEGHTSVSNNQSQNPFQVNSTNNKGSFFPNGSSSNSQFQGRDTITNNGQNNTKGNFSINGSTSQYSANNFRPPNNSTGSSSFFNPIENNKPNSFFNQNTFQSPPAEDRKTFGNGTNFPTDSIKSNTFAARSNDGNFGNTFTHGKYNQQSTSYAYEPPKTNMFTNLNQANNPFIASTTSNSNTVGSGNAFLDVTTTRNGPFRSANDTGNPMMGAQNTNRGTNWNHYHFGTRINDKQN